MQLHFMQIRKSRHGCSSSNSLMVSLVIGCCCVFFGAQAFAAPHCNKFHRHGRAELVDWNAPKPKALLGSPMTAPLRAASVVAAAAAAAAATMHPGTQPARGQRPKGVQELPLGSITQRLFSIRNRQLWDYKVYPRNYFKRTWAKKDVLYSFLFVGMHLGTLGALFCFSWTNFAVFWVLYVISGMGVTLSYHRQLAHRGFQTAKWLEYTLALCGMQAIQGHPIKWVLWHRQHHACCDTETDVHSPLDGFWWSHMGWMLEGKDQWLPVLKASAKDLERQAAYHFFKKYYHVLAIIIPIAGLYAAAGWPLVLWGFCARVVFLWHVTGAVNSLCHTWGFQDYKTGDQSMNNWLIGLFAFGEGWHNNHHAFETSVRHGLKWWQVDVSWYTIWVMHKLGLAWNLRLPSEKQKARLALVPA